MANLASRWVRPAALALLVGLALSMLRAAPAAAHATLVASHPTDGLVLDRAPEQVRLEFNEPVTPMAFRLVDSAGSSYDKLKVVARDAVVDIGLPPELPRGTQTLSYRIVSADGHPVDGILTFSVGAKGMAASIPAPAQGLGLAIWATRMVIYICLFAGVGGAFFRAIQQGTPPGGSNRGLLVLLGSGFLAMVVSVGLQGLDLLGLRWPDLLSAQPWETAVETSYGAMIGFGTAAVLAAGSSLNEARHWPKLGLATASLLGLGVAFASTGHASTAPPAWMMRPAVFLHVVGVAFWAGALIPLYSAAGLGSQILTPDLRRFSRIAAWVVPGLILMGLVIAIVQLQSARSLVSTDYGLLLSAKLAGVAGLLVLGTLNRRWLGTMRGPSSELTVRRLRISLVAEMMLMIVLAGVVAGWRFTPPPRSLLAPQPVTIHMHADQLMVMATVTPGRLGGNDLHLDVLGADLVPFPVKALEVSLSPADGGLEPRSFQARQSDLGSWEVPEFFVPRAGKWKLDVGALIDDFDRVDLSAEQEFSN